MAKPARCIPTPHAMMLGTMLGATAIVGLSIPAPAPAQSASRSSSPPAAATIELTWQPSAKQQSAMSITARVGASFTLGRTSGSADDRFTLKGQGKWTPTDRGRRIALNIQAQAGEQVAVKDTLTTDQGTRTHTTYQPVMGITTKTDTWIETDQQTVLSDTDQGKLTIKVTPIKD